MTRPLRRAVWNGGYHVFGRGLERRAVFGGEGGERETERDREHFLELLAEVHERYRVRIHAYALSLYVHLNPVRITGLGLDRNGRGMEGKGWRRPSREEVDARLRALREYRWSSYRAYAGYGSAPAWLETDELLSRAHRKAQQRQRAYRSAVRRLLARVEEAKGEPWARFAERYGDWGCALFLWGVRRVYGLTPREAGQAAGGIAAAAVYKAILRLEAQAASDQALRQAQARTLTLSKVVP